MPKPLGSTHHIVFLRHLVPLRMVRQYWLSPISAVATFYLYFLHLCEQCPLENGNSKYSASGYSPSWRVYGWIFSDLWFYKNMNRINITWKTKPKRWFQPAHFSGRSPRDGNWYLFFKYLKWYSWVNFIVWPFLSQRKSKWAWIMTYHHVGANEEHRDSCSEVPSQEQNDSILSQCHLSFLCCLSVFYGFCLSIYLPVLIQTWHL